MKKYCWRNFWLGGWAAGRLGGWANVANDLAMEMCILYFWICEIPYIS
jgi:hypothetical protein